MKILAKTTEGAEYLYSVRSAHKVSARSGQKIADALNKYGWQLETPDEIWHLYDVDEYDTAYDYAQFQSFTIRDGKIREMIRPSRIAQTQTNELSYAGRTYGKIL